MKALIVGFAALLSLSPHTISAQEPAPLSSLSAVHALTNQQAAHRLPAEFEATVTYFRSYERTLFVQDGNNAIYVQPSSPEYQLALGDRIRIQGTTRDSFHPFVYATKIEILRHGDRLKPIDATFGDLSHARYDSNLVRVQARVLAADISVSSDRPGTRLSLLMDGGPAEAYVDSSDPAPLNRLLDTQVEITGVVSGRFDGKMQMTGIVFHVQDMSGVRVLKQAAGDPWNVPLTSADQIFTAFSESNHSQRVRVQGVVTYYVPGLAAVLQEDAHSLWVNTHTRQNLKIGARAEATGFPDVHDGFLRLSQGEIKDTGQTAEVKPLAVKWTDLSSSRHVFDMVAIEGQVVAEVREAARDTYVLNSDGHVFSAVNRHPEQRILRSVPLPPLKAIPIGSRVRVVGVCITEDPNPFNGAVPVDLLMRSSEDITEIARPPLLSVANLVKVVSILILTVVLTTFWIWTLRRRVRQQTESLARRIEAEADQERRNAQLEQRRAHILEEINGNRALPELLEKITELVSFHLKGAPCWCEITDSGRFGQYVPRPQGWRIVRDEIPSRAGGSLGTLCAAMEPSTEPTDDEQLAFFHGTRLATLAIETRRLYTDLVHRSEFDLLTDVHNRFSLEKKLQAMISNAREDKGLFGLVFVDLDEFKQVNDAYGHHTGDLYLQQVAARMKRQLRSGDLLARLGGDEFAVLVSAAQTRSDAEEISIRLHHCFHDPFKINGFTIHGSASIGLALYPEDGTSKDSLLSAADAAMYVAKHTRRQP